MINELEKSLNFVTVFRSESKCDADYFPSLLNYFTLGILAWQWKDRFEWCSKLMPSNPYDAIK